MTWSPALLHALKLDPKISAGPVTLAFTDIFTLLSYFGVAAVLLETRLREESDAVKVYITNSP